MKIAARDVPKNRLVRRLNSNQTHQLAVDRQLAVRVVRVLHLLVGHELKCAVRDAQHARHETLNKKKKLIKQSKGGLGKSLTL